MDVGSWLWDEVLLLPAVGLTCSTLLSFSKRTVGVTSQAVPLHLLSSPFVMPLAPLV